MHFPELKNGFSATTRAAQSGQALVEYVLIVALSSLAVLGGITVVGRAVTAAYSEINCAVLESGASVEGCAPPLEPGGVADEPAETEKPEEREGHGYLRFVNRPSITVNRTHKPQLTVEYGNDGDGPLENVTIVCTIPSGPAHFVSTVQDGLFGSSHKTGDVLTYSAMGSALAAGQSSTVAFSVNPNRGTAEVRCTLNASNAASASDLLTVFVT